MTAILLSFFMLFAEGGSNASGGFSEFWETYFNYPGFELWRFLNLLIFVVLLAWFVKKPLSEAFKAKREEIRAELIKAEREKKAALARLAEIEAKLAGTNAEAEALIREAREEIEQEKRRLAEQAEIEAKKLRAQAEGEINRIGQVTHLELRRFAANESLRLAEEKLRMDITPEADSRLIRSGIQSIGGVS